MGLGVIAAVTGWHPFGWDADEEPALVRAPEVRVVNEAIVPPNGDGPPVYVATLWNRGDRAAVWARPSIVYASDVRAGRSDAGRVRLPGRRPSPFEGAGRASR